MVADINIRIVPNSGTFNTYTLVSNPRQIRVSGEIPIGIQTAAPVMTVLLGWLKPTISSIAPISWRRENMIRRTHPEELEKPWRMAKSMLPVRAETKNTTCAIAIASRYVTVIL